MAQQTINVGAAPNDGTGTPLRTAFQYTNSNFTELYTAVGPSGNNIVVPGSATITGDLTLSAGTVNGVGYLNASKVLTAGSALVFDGTNLGIGGTGQLRFTTSGGAIGDNSIGTENSFSMMLRCGRGSTSNIELASDKLVFSTSASERYRIASDGIATWSNVGGVAGTAMTLNSTGLGVGTSPTSKLTIGTGSFSAAASGTTGMYTTASGLEMLSDSYFFGSRSGFGLMTLNSSGNVGIGVTPVNKLTIGTGTFNASTVSGSSSLYSTVAQGLVILADGLAVATRGGVNKLIANSAGDIISSVTGTAPSLTDNGFMVFNLTSNTNLRISVRGTDGTTRTANLTLA